MLQKPVLEALRTQAFGLAQHSVDQSYARLDHDHRRRLATGEIIHVDAGFHMMGLAGDEEG